VYKTKKQKKKSYLYSPALAITKEASRIHLVGETVIIAFNDSQLAFWNARTGKAQGSAPLCS
jgi:hypothetical protein